MIAPEIDVRWEGIQKSGKRMKDLKLWDDAALKTTQKVMEIAATVTMAIKDRVMVHGLDRSGSRFAPYATKNRIAVPPWYPQPRAAGRFRAHDRTNAYAWYPSRAAYQKARKLPAQKNFFASGGMWTGLVAKAVGPGHVRVSFGGNSPRMSASKSFFRRQKKAMAEGRKIPRKQTMQNRQKAKFVAKQAGRDLLAFNVEEARLYLDLMSQFVGTHCLLDLDEQRRVFEMRKFRQNVKRKQAAYKRKAKKLMAKAAPGTGKPDPKLS